MKNKLKLKLKKTKYPFIELSTQFKYYEIKNKIHIDNCKLTLKTH